jgi:hypothetical protein
MDISRETVYTTASDLYARLLTLKRGGGRSNYINTDPDAEYALGSRPYDHRSSWQIIKDNILED